ncbi:uncharacterized protein UPF0158 [Paenibacillus cellulosilyticus]|uniref:Uncharacterized protein UPF0158 n=1 Tax=Paenibacillus cellulosilyticus TaxID=375489 RepID=A0A2V2YZN7_9BACL|nr:UPF0158 family protein [Paenibacillus cellulosilyticus]PWW07529.1 uncharacterized protein UPF0158 [Paenibacillus cellulosilyticus]
MKILKITKDQFKELADTYDTHTDGMDWYLNIETGEIVMLRDFDVDDEEEELNELVEEGFNMTYFRIPQRDSNEGYCDMVDFTETVQDAALRLELCDILNGGRKIFRRFKDELSSNKTELERYYRYLESRNRDRILDWLEEINVQLALETEQ